MILQYTLTVHKKTTLSFCLLKDNYKDKIKELEYIFIKPPSPGELLKHLDLFTLKNKLIIDYTVITEAKEIRDLNGRITGRMYYMSYKVNRVNNEESNNNSSRS